MDRKIVMAFQTPIQLLSEIIFNRFSNLLYKPVWQDKYQSQLKGCPWMRAINILDLCIFYVTDVHKKLKCTLWNSLRVNVYRLVYFEVCKLGAWFIHDLPHLVIIRVHQVILTDNLVTYHILKINEQLNLMKCLMIWNSYSSNLWVVINLTKSIFVQVIFVKSSFKSKHNYNHRWRVYSLIILNMYITAETRVWLKRNTS